MAQIKRSTRFDIAIKNQENARMVGKTSLPPRKAAAATKRTVLGEIGNEISRRGVSVVKKVETKPVAVKKEKEQAKEKSVVPVTDKVSVRPRPPLRKAVSTSSLTTCEPLEDIDKNDKDPGLVGEYVNDIYDYLREIETKYPIQENFLDGQEVTGRMRALLVDWLVDVHTQFHLLLETLYLTVSIIDRYLQEVRTVSKKKLQLVGVGAMFVACKYEEMYSPVVSDFEYICDKAYTIEEILQMERLIVRTLDYSFCKPLPLHFLRRYSKAAHATIMDHHVAKYVLELSLLEHDLCHYPPSLLSAAAMYLGLWVFTKKNLWTKTLEHYSTYKYTDIEPLVKKLAKIVLKAEKSKYKAVAKKYAQSKYLKVSCIPELRSDALQKFATSP